MLHLQLKINLKTLLPELRGFMSLTTLVLVFNKIESKDQIKFDNSYLSLKAEITMKASGIDNLFEPIYSTMISHKQKSLGEGSAWTIDFVIDCTISTSKSNRSAARTYVKLQKELDHPRKWFIHIQNIDDNECFKLSFIRYLNSVDQNPRRITKADNKFAKSLYFKKEKVPVKIREIHKIEKMSSIDISVFDYEKIM